MNNEPVAWQHKVAKSWVTTTKDGDDDEWIPLYTHPAKTLTDDAQYDRGFDAGCKHAENNLQAEIEQLKYDLAVNENYLLLERQYSEKLWKQLNPIGKAKENE